MVVMLLEVDLRHQLAATITLSIMKKELMLDIQVYIGIRSATLTPVFEVTVVYILTSSVSSCCADESVHEKENGYISFNDGDVKQKKKF